MIQKRLTGCAARAALAALLAVGSTAPAWAGPSTLNDEPNWLAPSLQLDGDALEVVGERGARLLLLYGEAFCPSDETDGRRVEAARVVEIELDLDGRRRLPGHGGVSRMLVQAWQPTGAQAGGSFSIPVTLGAVTSPMASLAQPGDLVLTEFMKDPTAVTDTHGEWIEVCSNKAWRLDIEGMTISDLSGASYTLNNGGSGIFLSPGERFVIGNDSDPSTNGGVPVNWQWSSFSLKNSADEIFLHSATGKYLDGVIYDDGQRWPDTPGMSIALTDPITSSIANNDPDLWCSSSSNIGAGPDTGTPGAVNDTCP